MNKLEEFDEQNLVNSPYRYSLVIPVTEVVSDVNFTKDPEDGLVLNSKFYLERTKSTRIYYCEDCKNFIYNLSDKAQRLYWYIVLNMKTGKDYIQLNMEHYMTQNSIKSKSTYYNALKELIRYSFIAATEYKTVFYINPNIAFSGNRLKKFPKNMQVQSKWEQ